MMTKREFHGEDFYVWAVKQYEAARVFLKSCGSPMNDYDKFLIVEAKWDSAFFKRIIN